jgi:hypothetical protein
LTTIALQWLSFDVSVVEISATEWRAAEPLDLYAIVKSRPQSIHSSVHVDLTKHDFNIITQSIKCKFVDQCSLCARD